MTALAGRSGRGDPLRILITGAGGFVGRHLVVHLLDRARSPENQLGAPEARANEPGANEHAEGGAGADVRIIATVDAAHGETPFRSRGAAMSWMPDALRDRVTVYPLDIRDAAATASLMALVRPHQIYHLAARSSGGDQDRAGVFAVNVAGTENLLMAAAMVSPLPRMLLVSTGYVYGDTDPLRPAREDDPLAPMGRYGAYTDSKIEMERTAQAYSSFTLVARAFGHTGPWQAPVFALPSFARQLARIEAELEPPELLVGNLDVYRDLLDVRDVVRAYCLLMAQGAPGTTVNVAAGKPLSMRVILDRLCALASVPVTVTTDPQRYRKADIACSAGDPSMLQALTGWRPHYPLEATLAVTLDYWRARVSAG